MGSKGGMIENTWNQSIVVEGPQILYILQTAVKDAGLETSLFELACIS